MIERKVADALALDYPRERLEVVVASDGSKDRTAELARAAGADLVLELPRGGKVAALNAAVRETRRRDRRLLGREQLLGARRAARGWSPASPTSASATSAARSASAAARAATRRASTGATRWRCAGWSRGWRGSPRATARSTRCAARPTSSCDPSRGQDIGFPFELTKRGWRAVYEPAAVAEEKMAPTVEGEFRRKRRMMWGLWDVMLRWGMLDPRGYAPAYALEIYSHRLLRYLTPVAAPGRARGERRPARRRGRLRRDHGAAAGPAGRRRCSAASCPCCRSGSPTTTSP